MPEEKKPEFRQQLVTGLTRAQLESLIRKKLKEREKTRPILEIIQEAGTMHIPVLIKYFCEHHGVRENRIVDPYEFKGYGDNYVLWAHCHFHHKTHSFSMRNIESAEKRPDVEWEGPFPYIGPIIRTPETEIGVMDISELTRMGKKLAEEL